MNQSLQIFSVVKNNIFSLNWFPNFSTPYLVGFLLSLSTDYNLHFKYINLDNLQVKPIFTLKIKILSEKIPVEKKIIQSIKKNVGLSKADEKEHFEMILDS